ncbi:hypothetical protein [Chitinophaga sp. CF418]|uniref:hypothetical protein n=1 Tax=Chitinophaga sp. CF418 TaxID=1855287 RepID=UPI0009210640|nr:hypothetical protein [Chitinophaga sp. CF418]SHN22961.1 hypothetical protein SAMN05216311_107108 [Chitinophaga sp. CF418]
MRSLSYLCLLIMLFCCGLTVNAAITGCHKASAVSPSTRPFLKILSCDRELRRHGMPSSPETIITTPQRSVIGSVKSDTRDGADTVSAHFLAGTSLFSCKVQAVRLLSDLHAIIRSLIYPQHIFW